MNGLMLPLTSGYLDPGIAALVGAAAFLGGSGRVTLFTTVMMVEISGDPVMIFPVGFATVFGVLVGNAINHGLYHALIDVQSVPYLPDSWQVDQLPPGIVVKDMMPKNDPILIPVSGGSAGVHKAIDGNTYTRFPLVNEAGVVIGMCSRDDMEELLTEEEDKAKYYYDNGNDDESMSFEKRQKMLGEKAPATSDSLTAEQMKIVKKASNKPIKRDDLMYIADLYPITVRENFPLRMAYQLFKAMDMQSLIVVDDNHVPKAVMTRFAFLSWRVRDRLGDTVDALQQREDKRRHRAKTMDHDKKQERDASLSFFRRSVWSEKPPGGLQETHV